MAKITPEKASELADIVRRGISALSHNRISRYQRNRANYYNDPDTARQLPFRHASSYHMPVVQPIADDLMSMVVGAVASGDPICVAQVFSDDVAEESKAEASQKLERTLQFFVEQSGLREALRKVAIPAVYANIGWLKTEWDNTDRQRPKLLFRVVEPMAAFVEPGWVASLQRSKAHGDVYYRLREEIQQLQDAGLYDKSVMLPESVFDERTDAMSATKEHRSAGQPIEGGEKLGRVKLADTLCKEGDSWYRAIVAPDHKAVLKHEPWPYRTSRYAEFSFKPTSSHDGYWPATSVAQDLQQIQALVSDLWTHYVNGTRFNIYGALFAEGGVDAPTAAAEFGPGEIHVINARNLMPYNPKADIGSIPGTVGQLLDWARQVARVSLNASGVGDPSTSTATEAAIAQQGTQSVTDDYVATFGRGVTQLYEHVQEMLMLTWDEWFPLYGAALGLEEDDQSLFGSVVLWRLTVDSMGAAPGAQIAAAMQLVGLTQDPEFGLDKHELAKRIIQHAERQGFTDAAGLQRPRDPGELVDFMAAQLGVDPAYLDAALDAALDAQQSDLAGGMDGMEAFGGVGGLPGGGAQAPLRVPGGLGGLPGGQGAGMAGSGQGLPPSP